MYEKLSKHIGMFVNLDSVEVSVDTYDSVYSYPKNVGIIINQNCGSTTEQFLLAAKQSKKVKLFGTPTFGALDISNMNFVDSPCKDYKLGYCLSKSLRIPNFTVDDKGIQPDFFIDRTIPDFKWIDFVESILLNKN
jgi:C-terminal processing protease CtpA/Prc